MAQILQLVRMILISASIERSMNNAGRYYREHESAREQRFTTDNIRDIKETIVPQGQFNFKRHNFFIELETILSCSTTGKNFINADSENREQSFTRAKTASSSTMLSRKQSQSWAGLLRTILLERLEVEERVTMSWCW